MGNSGTTGEKTPPEAAQAAEIRAYVERLAISPAFASSSRRTRLLKYLVERALADLPPGDLRALAGQVADRIDDRDVPLAVLCLRFGVDRQALAQAVAAARVVAAAYPLDSGVSEAADAALGRLVELFAERAYERAGPGLDAAILGPLGGDLLDTVRTVAGLVRPGLDRRHLQHFHPGDLRHFARGCGAPAV